MTISAIKSIRASRIASVGKFPASFEAMLRRIPGSVAAALTSTQIAALADAMWDACQEAKGLALTNAVTEGVVWDAGTQRLREIA